MAVTERHVTPAGAGAHDGTTKANAFSITEMVTDINTPRTGHVYHVYGDSGTYTLTASLTITGDGTSAAPNVIKGCNAAPGDLDAFAFDAQGDMNLTGFPIFAFDATFKYDASTADFLTTANIKFTGNISGFLVSPMQADGTVRNCFAQNDSTNAAAGGIDTGGNARPYVLDCQVVLAASGGTAGIRTQATTAIMDGCRVTAPGCAGIINRGTTRNCVVYDCGTTGISSDAAGGTPIIERNTIYSCGGDGIDIVTGATGAAVIRKNHITDNGGWGIDLNTPGAGFELYIDTNRTRDNTSGRIRGNGDVMDWNPITSDDADTDDFTDPGAGDFSMKSTAAGYGKAGHLVNVGAQGTPQAAGGAATPHVIGGGAG